MNAEHTCQKCGKKITLKWDAAYLEIGDPYKLLKKAVCNDCADHHDKLNRVTDSLEEIAFKVRMEKDKDQRAKMGEIARMLLKAYMRLECEHRGLKTVIDWDEEILNQFMEHPEKIAAVASTIRLMVENALKQGTLL